MASKTKRLPRNTSLKDGSVDFTPTLMSFWPSHHKEPGTPPNSFTVRTDDVEGRWLFTVVGNPAFSKMSMDSLMWLICTAPELYQALRDVAVIIAMDANHSIEFGRVLKLLLEASDGIWPFGPTIRVDAENLRERKRSSDRGLEQLPCAQSVQLGGKAGA